MSKDTERKTIRELVSNLTLQEGQSVYIVAREWWEDMCKFYGFNPDNAAEDKGKPNDLKPRAITAGRILKRGDGYVELEKGIREHAEYEIVSKEAWDYLVETFGVADEESVVARNVVAFGFMRETRVELFPLLLVIASVAPGGDVAEKKTVKSFSPNVTLSAILKEFAPTTPAPEGRVWRWGVQKDGDEEDLEKDTSDPPEPAWHLLPESGLELSLQVLNLESGTKLLLEHQDEQGHWKRSGSTKENWRDFEVNDIIDCLDTEKKWYESIIRTVKDDKILVHYINWPKKYDEWVDRTSDRLAARNTHTKGPYKPRSRGYGGGGWGRENAMGAPDKRGAVGLRNLGNTCFMNSTLQCMAQTPGLTPYFVDQDYMKEINRDNPLGFRGKVVDAYGKLLQDMWSGKCRVVAPSVFKQTIGEFQPQFQGYQQHDSSELLSFLLDGLHEDLNRIQKKPYTEKVECNSNDDMDEVKKVADEAWRRHKLRNCSKIVDQFQGQLMSTVKCPDCGRVSVTFDPFLFLSVPLPKKLANHTVRFIRHPLTSQLAGEDSPHPVVYNVRAAQSPTGGDIANAVAEIAGAPTNAKFLLVARICGGKISGLVAKDESVRIFRDESLWVFEAPTFKEQARLKKLIESGGLKKKDGEEKGSSSSGDQDETDGKEEYDMKTMQVVHNVASSEHRHEVIYRPTALLLPARFDKAMEADDITPKEMYELVVESLLPFIKGGRWPENVKPEDAFQIRILDRWGDSTRSEYITMDSDPINLRETFMYGFSWGVFWKDGHEKSILIPEEELFLEHDSYKTAKESSEKGSSGIQLSECMEMFSAKETLSPQDAWYCSQCKKHQQADKKFDLWRMPDVLIVHLKRFHYTGHYRDKISTLVDFPIKNLDMSKWVSNAENNEDNVYNLYAVSNHFGGLGGGHYTAYARNLIDGSWHTLDDSSVMPMRDPKDAITSAAYVLFYVRQKADTTTRKATKTVRGGDSGDN